jgi:NAD(P)-dependent dehydrogenase (short-subunit alcohol dehydrogenase family)
MGGFDGKTAIVTGASRGIGRATALKLAAAGCSVFLAADGTVEELEDAVREIRDGGGSAEFAIADLSGESAAEAMVEAALAAFGRIDILVNNAGIRIRRPFGAFTHEDFDTLVAVNLRAAFFASQAVLPAMRAAGGGRIVHVASQMGMVASETLALYGMAKAALIHLARSMALELAPENIVVNAVSPGPIATEFNLERWRQEPERHARVLAKIPAGRTGKADEVASAILFLASADATFINGHNLVIDGGYIIH